MRIAAIETRIDGNQITASNTLFLLNLLSSKISVTELHCSSKLCPIGSTLCANGENQDKDNVLSLLCKGHATALIKGYLKP